MENTVEHAITRFIEREVAHSRSLAIKALAAPTVTDSEGWPSMALASAMSDAGQAVAEANGWLVAWKLAEQYLRDTDHLGRSSEAVHCGRRDPQATLCQLLTRLAVLTAAVPAVMVKLDAFMAEVNKPGFDGDSYFEAIDRLRRIQAASS